MSSWPIGSGDIDALALLRVTHAGVRGPFMAAARERVGGEVGGDVAGWVCNGAVRVPGGLDDCGSKDLWRRRGGGEDTEAWCRGRPALEAC